MTLDGIPGLRLASVHEVPIAAAIDDDACTAFDELDPRFAIALGEDHPFVRAERARWAAAASAGTMWFACAPDGTPVGVVVLDTVDGLPHLEQVSVRRVWGRHGIGRAFVEHAVRWAEPKGELWLTTYDHVPWNRPWYERRGFVVVPEAECGPEIRTTLDLERRALPDPDHRVAMVHRRLTT